MIKSCSVIMGSANDFKFHQTLCDFIETQDLQAGVVCFLTWAGSALVLGSLSRFSIGLTGSELVSDEGGRALSKEAEPEAGHSFDPLSSRQLQSVGKQHQSTRSKKSVVEASKYRNKETQRLDK